MCADCTPALGSIPARSRLCSSSPRVRGGGAAKQHVERRGAPQAARTGNKRAPGNDLPRETGGPEGPAWVPPAPPNHSRTLRLHSPSGSGQIARQPEMPGGVRRRPARSGQSLREERRKKSTSSVNPETVVRTCNGPSRTGEGGYSGAKARKRKNEPWGVDGAAARNRWSESGSRGPVGTPGCGRAPCAHGRRESPLSILERR
jgi:hypothetical protein